MNKANSKSEYLLNVAKDLRAEADRFEAKAEKLKDAKKDDNTLPPCIVNVCWACTSA